jgi:TRAP-type C4-dicarboxylate transport system permease large subunit
MFVDQLVVIVVLAPIFYPIAVKAGIDPIHLGIIVSLQAAIGSITPPFGCNIFTASAIFDQSFTKVVKGLPPYLVILGVISIVMIFVPEVALFFRDLAYH